ncbi:RNA methyltransferase [Alteromonas australica]|uniref:cytochrome b n=1 Tax=Alteromonas TaxID=226 RepID=UPI0005C3EE09|nr:MULTISPECIES: cytochrome b [Alteromonas]AJP43466.1 RNA methyltransferase [Alteromonas australica]QPL48744.1 cytochrome b [Alteromonas sp. B31-7]HBF70893.1 cytochrome b [Alteromonas australica]|tara:strand:- start:1472 stop:2032 length:561 start_codon:yes stop_codon:yes gene_type:complete
MQYDSATKFSPVTLLLHWVVGLTIIGMLATGIYMAEEGVYSLFPIHKATGFILLFVALARVVWRMKNGWPTPAGQYASWEHTLATVVHWVLIVSTLLMPISGLMGSVLGGHGLDVFGLEVFAPNFSVEDPEKTLPINYALSKLGSAIHFYLGYTLIAALVLHIAGALKHHLVDKDGTLKRMLGKQI